MTDIAVDVADVVVTMGGDDSNRCWSIGTR
jgi:hypothetical protein